MLGRGAGLHACDITSVTPSRVTCHVSRTAVHYEYSAVSRLVAAGRVTVPGPPPHQLGSLSSLQNLNLLHPVLTIQPRPLL